jgi:hypothetical protein
VGSQPLLSIRVDDGARLPVRVKHDRPVEMLLEQAAHEPDVVGRVEALEQLAEVCVANGPSPACAGRADTFARLEESERSPLMRRELGAARRALTASAPATVGGTAPSRALTGAVGSPGQPAPP